LRYFFLFSWLLRSLFHFVFGLLFLFLIRIVNTRVLFLLLSIVVQLSIFFLLSVFGFLSVLWLCFDNFLCWLCFNNFLCWLLVALLSCPYSNLFWLLLKYLLFLWFKNFNRLLLHFLLNNFSWLRLYFWLVSEVTKLHSHFFCFATRIMS